MTTAKYVSVATEQLYVRPIVCATLTMQTVQGESEICVKVQTLLVMLERLQVNKETRTTFWFVKFFVP